jgi:hypothetical protein
MTEAQAQNIELAHGEPALPDVATAQQLALAARTEREQAEQAVTTAKAARDSAKAEYIASPTSEGDDACERGEAAVRRAERYAEAMFARLSATEKTLDDAKRAAAVVELEAAGEERDQIRRELAGHFHTLRNLHAHCSQTIAQIEAVCARDIAVSEAATRSARMAGISGSARAVDPEIVRLAAGVLLAGNRPRRSHHLSNDAAMPMMKMITEIFELHGEQALVPNPRLTPDERGAVLRLALDEYVRATGASEVSDWIGGPRHAPPQALNHTAAASRHRQAHALLAFLESENGEKQ